MENLTNITDITVSCPPAEDIDKNDVEAYLTSPRRRSVVIDDERCVEIPIQMNPQLDASKLRSVAGRPPTPIPSDEEGEDEEEQAQSSGCSGRATDLTEEGAQINDVNIKNVYGGSNDNNGGFRAVSTDSS